jgi:hypothetical protein
MKYPRTYEYGGMRLGLLGESWSAEASLGRSKRREGMLELYAVDVLDCATRYSLWRWRLDQHEPEETIRDYRQGGAPYSKRELTDAETDQFIRPWPRFGEFDVLGMMVREVLRNKGYGEIP